MNKIEEQLMHAYATMVMGGAMSEDEVPETLVLIEGAEPTTMRELVKIEVARRIIEKLSQPEPEPTITEEIMNRIDAVEMAVVGLMEMMTMMLEEPEVPEEEEGGEE